VQEFIIVDNRKQKKEVNDELCIVQQEFRVMYRQTVRTRKMFVARFCSGVDRRARAGSAHSFTLWQ